MHKIVKAACGERASSFDFKRIYAQNLVARVSSYITDAFPRLGKFATNAFAGLLYNYFFVSILVEFDKRIAKKIKDPEHIMIVSDLNIGDAINLQGVIFALKSIFPNVDIDYAVNKAAKNLVELNPNVRTTLDVLSYDVKDSIEIVSRIVNHGNYDLVINLCPFIKKSDIIEDKKVPYIGFGSLAGRMIYNEIYSGEINHVSYQAYKYFYGLFSGEPLEFEFTPTLWLSDEAIFGAKYFLKENRLSGKGALVLFNPDATSKYTQMPFFMQLRILDRLCKSENISTILLTSGHTFNGVERVLLKTLGGCKKVSLVPRDIPLDVYSALIDLCDVFVTSDTGTMHIAAAKRFNDKSRPLNNKTAIFAVFGATSARMYGYSSFYDGFLDSAQDAPAYLYFSDVPCRNITCSNKKYKMCRRLRCFNGIDGNKIAEDIISYIS